MNTPTVTIRMPAEMRDKLDELARVKGCNRQDLILEGVQLWLKGHQVRPVHVVRATKPRVAGTFDDKRRWWHPRWSTKKGGESHPAPGVTIGEIVLDKPT